MRDGACSGCRERQGGDIRSIPSARALAAQLGSDGRIASFIDLQGVPSPGRWTAKALIGTHKGSFEALIDNESTLDALYILQRFFRIKGAGLFILICTL